MAKKPAVKGSFIWKIVAYNANVKKIEDVFREEKR